MKWERVDSGRYRSDAGYLVVRSWFSQRKWVWRSARMTHFRGYHRTMREAMAAAESHRRHLHTTISAEVEDE